MTFQVPTEDSSKRFEFSIGKGKFSVPLLEDAPVGAVEHLEVGRNVAALLACCDNDEARDAVRGLGGGAFRALLDAWTEASALTPGESSPSGN